MTQRDRAERTLIAATSTAESMTIDMAKEFRNRTGMPADLTRKVLDRAEELLQQLTRAGEDTPYLRRSRSVVLTELARTYLVLGDSEAALAAAHRARAMLEAVRTTSGNGTCRSPMTSSARRWSHSDGARRRSPYTGKVSPSASGSQPPIRPTGRRCATSQ